MNKIGRVRPEIINRIFQVSDNEIISLWSSLMTQRLQGFTEYFSRPTEYVLTAEEEERSSRLAEAPRCPAFPSAQASG